MSGVCVFDRKDWGKGMHAVFPGTLECRRRKKNRGRQAGWRHGQDFPAHYTTLSGCCWRSAPGSMWVPWTHIPPSPEPDECPPGGFARSRSLSLFSLSLALCRSFFPFFYFLILSLTVQTGTRPHMTRAKKHSQMQQADHAAL